MKDCTKRYLENLENLIDEGAYCKERRELQKRHSILKRWNGHLCVISYMTYRLEEWPSYNFNEFYHDKEKMLLSELKNVYLGARLKDDRLYRYQGELWHWYCRIGFWLSHPYLRKDASLCKRSGRD